MARIRTVKPDLFRHHELYKIEIESGLPLRIAFVGLFTAADREGRFKWRPQELKLDVLPHDNIDFNKVLDILAAHGFLKKYSSNGESFGCIPSWRLHQVINFKEKQSILPDPESETSQISDLPTREPRVNHAKTITDFQDSPEGKGREGKGREGETKPTHPSEISDSMRQDPVELKPEVLLELWQKNRGPFSEVKTFNESRRQKAKSQLARYPDLNHWSEVLDRWKKSEFCTSKWVPDFDAWMTESKRIQTLEGRYDDRKQEVKKDQWVEMAVQVTGVLRKIGNMESDSGDKIRAIVGDRVFQIMRGVHGGIFGLRMMPENDFKLKKMANLLKESAEKGIKNDSKSEGIGEHSQPQDQEFPQHR